MEPILESSVCLICFGMIEKHISVPSDVPEKLFINCNKYLHSTLTKGILKDIEQHNEYQVPLCKKCFDSALELTQLSEKLTTIQNDISDLAVEFSMAIFHRRSQVYGIGQSCKTSSIVEFNEACLPPNLFSKKLGDRNIHPHPNKNNQEMDINGFYLQTDISDVKCEASGIQFDNFTGNPQQSIANEDLEIFNKENVDKHCGQSTIVPNQNLVSVSEMRIVHVTGSNDSKKCADPNNEVKLTMSELLTSVKMPKIILERIKIVGHKLDVSVVNSNQTKPESPQENIDKTLYSDDGFSVHSFAPKNPEDRKLLKCFYCKKTFTQECHRSLHHKSHTGDKLYKRPLGKQKFVYRNNLKKWQITPTGKRRCYKCSYCEKLFPTPSTLQIHERTHTGEKPFKCSFCDNRFNCSSNLKLHERTHTGEKPFKCSFCNKRFTESNHLKQHERIHTGEKPFKCSVCNKRFNHSGSLKLHERTHTGEKPFKCSFCDNRFNCSGHLKRHERIHTGEKPFKCSFCDNRFNQASNLKVHERTHTGEKPLKCSSYSERFNFKSTLKRHETTHTGEKPFKCSFCNNRFNELGHLKRHERIHTGEKPFKCSVCNKQFIQSTSLKRHERTHTGEKPFKCSFCDNRFNCSSNLKVHETTHTGERPYKCSVCNYRFARLSRLRLHEKTHSGGKKVSTLISQVGSQFKCSFCEMIYSHDEERANHEKIHRRENEILNENLILGI